MRRFKIIVSICEKNDIGLNGILPWKIRKDLKTFRNITIGNGNNAIIMGRITFENLMKYRIDFFLFGKIIVLTTKPQNGLYENKKKDCLDTDIKFLPSIDEALNQTINNKDVFIVGGDLLYKLLIDKYMYLCDQVLISKVRGRHECNSFFHIRKYLNIVNLILLKILVHIY
jgi:dihydrofolate reductase